MKRYLTAVVLLCSLVLAAAVASAALVRTGDLILTADGGFTPRELPRRSFAPIEFRGHADIVTISGAVPPAVQRVVLDFDRDGRLTTRGLPVCEPGSIENAAPAQARSTCPGAIVGTGHVAALIAVDGQPPIEAKSALTLFNGPRQDGSATVVLHAQTTVPALQTFAVVVPIVRRSGAYAYKATFQVPAIAGGRGSLVHVDVRVGKRYSFGGAELSYVRARCSDNVLETRGRFDFADGNVIYGPVMKPCRFR